MKSNNSDSALSDFATSRSSSSLRRPQSPFLRPSTPEPVQFTQTTLTPNQTRVRIERELVLRRKSGGTDAPPTKSTLFGSFANLFNAIVGAGIIGIPYALKECGLVVGLLLLVLVAVLTDKSLRMLIETGRVVDATSYERLMEAVFGKPGFVFISLNMLFMSYGAMVCYLLIIKETLPMVMGYDMEDVWIRRQILLASSLLIILPLSMQRDMADLDKTSKISVLFDFIMVIIIAIYAPINETIESYDGGLREMVLDSTLHPRTIFVGLGVLSFAFVCQDCSFIIAGSLDRPTTQRWAIVTGFSITTCAFLAAIVGTMGYLGFGDSTQGNILNNFPIGPSSGDDAGSTSSSFWPSTQTAANIARLLLGSTMFCVYPLSSYVARHALIVLLFQGRRAHYGDDHTVLARTDRRIVLTLALYISALVPSLLFDNVGTVLAVTGAVAGSCLSYLGPGAAYLGIHGWVLVKLVKKRWGVGGEKVRWLLWRFPRDGESGTEGEVTPLVALPIDQDAEESKSQETEDVGFLRCALDVCSWYIFFMPIWCSIASIGIEKMRAKELESPMPNRFGNIIRFYRKASFAEVNALNGEYGTVQDANSDALDRALMKKPLQFIPPAPANGLSRPVAVYPKSDFDSKHKESQIRSIHNNISISSIRSIDCQDQGETESHNTSPSPQWFDFALAALYILLGLLALCAGLVSILS